MTTAKRWGVTAACTLALAMVETAAAFQYGGPPCQAARVHRRFSGLRTVRLAAGNEDVTDGSRRTLLQAFAVGTLFAAVKEADAAPFGLGDQQGGAGWGEAQKAGVSAVGTSLCMRV